MKRIELKKWRAAGSLPYQADFSKHIQKGAMFRDQTPWFDASVPGCIYDDLQKAHLIEDPYYGQNSLACEWVANRWWIYNTSFTLEKSDFESVLRLRFEGIDYSAQIYLGGVFLGRHEGMYHPFEVTINESAVAGENTLVCVLEHAPFADPQPGYTSKTRYLKSRCNYKWDFAARLVSLGLYGAVTITSYPACEISSRFIRPIKENGEWSLEVKMDAECYLPDKGRVSFKLSRNGESIIANEDEVSFEKGKNEYSAVFKVTKPELWWPNGYGEQALYDYELSVLTSGGLLSDTVSGKTGFRTLEYRHADGREDALKYNVAINGKRVYLKGTNMVPLDCMTGKADYNRTKEILTAAKEANINFLRIWGGGHIENEDYYSICDELGLMILQEFTMSSSGCDDVPSRNPEFLALLKTAAEYNMKLKRNHVSLIFWDGGNELTDEKYIDSEDHEGHPATLEDSTLSMLAELAKELSPDVAFLPSSGSGPNALLKWDEKGTNHDVHGPWGYMGVEKHYTLYNNSDSIVHGEFGCGGMTGYDQLCRITAEKDRIVTTSDENAVWAHHSGGWDSYKHREQVMFGDLRSFDIKDYIKISQFVQFESLRYSLEANRCREWTNVGEMTWQFNEPWPNIQCSNVLEYYGSKKAGYYALQQAYSPILTHLKYQKLFYSPKDEASFEIYIVNDRKTADFTINYSVVSSNDTLLSGEVKGIAEEDKPQCAASFSFKLPHNLESSFSVILETHCGDYYDKKEYLMLIADRKLKIYFSSDDELRAALFNRTLDEARQAPRAYYKPVLEYMNRHFEY